MRRLERRSPIWLCSSSFAASVEMVTRCTVSEAASETGQAIDPASHVRCDRARPAHGIKDKTEAAYRRTAALEKRRKLMEAWAQFCSTPKAEATVVMLHGAA